MKSCCLLLNQDPDHLCIIGCQLHSLLGGWCQFCSSLGGVSQDIWTPERHSLSESDLGPPIIHHAHHGPRLTSSLISNSDFRPPTPLGSIHFISLSPSLHLLLPSYLYIVPWHREVPHWFSHHVRSPELNILLGRTSVHMVSHLQYRQQRPKDV